ncbi:MAG: hypothetical protein JST70_15905 [Bacteroidetes bacterium]|nr:hypothetical protein [Bacteroidota bacterium]
MKKLLIVLITAANFAQAQVPVFKSIDINNGVGNHSGAFGFINLNRKFIIRGNNGYCRHGTMYKRRYYRQH